MVYAIVVGFSLLCGGGAILVLLLGWTTEEEQIRTHSPTGAGLGTEPHIPSIDEIQGHIDAELADLDEFAAHPSARSLYSTRGGTVSVA